MNLLVCKKPFFSLFRDDHKLRNKCFVNTHALKFLGRLFYDLCYPHLLTHLYMSHSLLIEWNCLKSGLDLQLASKFVDGRSRYKNALKFYDLPYVA